VPIDSIVNADSDALIGAYENRLRSLEAAKVEAKEKIADCGRPLADFDTTYRTAMEFLENPSKMWVFGDLVDKRAALKLTFEGRIRYKRNEGYRTAEAAIPFRIFNGLGCEDSEESEMVPRKGLEPSRPFGHRYLKPARLPIPPPGQGGFPGACLWRPKRRARYVGLPRLSTAAMPG
jgi:site-specific DNA recombinase